MFKENQILSFFDISNNQISDDGMEFLVKALKNNQHIHSLNLENCDITEKSEDSFKLLFPTMIALKEFNISKNTIRNKGATALVETLLEDKNCNIQHLNLSTCGLKIKAMQRIFKALRRNYTLKELLLDYNELDYNTLATFKDSMKTNMSLRKLSLCGC